MLNFERPLWRSEPGESYDLAEDVIADRPFHDGRIEESASEPVDLEHAARMAPAGFCFGSDDLG